MQGYPLGAAEPRGIPSNITLSPEHFKRLGYVTRLIGKWHVGYHTKKHTPVNRGFDSFFGYYNGMIQYFNHTYTQDVCTIHILISKTLFFLRIRVVLILAMLEFFRPHPLKQTMLYWVLELIFWDF